MIRLPQWQFVEDEKHHWHWTRTSPNGESIESANAFSNRADRLDVQWGTPTREVQLELQLQLMTVGYTVAKAH
jgi:hypothetical protein